VTDSEVPSMLPLRDHMRAVAAHLARSDQRHWAVLLQDLAAGLDADPGPTARAVLALFEGPGAGDRAPTQGDWALHTIVLTTGGSAFDRPGVTWEDAMDYAEQVHAMYLAAVTVWLACGNPPPLSSGGGEPVKLADYGFGEQIWGRDGQFFARYEFGGRILAWREDVISPDEARWGLLGARHFTFMAKAVLARLSAAGIDAWPGNHEPLPEP
jgi:hypothetical protein